MAIWRSSNATVCKTVMGGCNSHCGLKWNLTGELQAGAMSREYMRPRGGVAEIFLRRQKYYP